MKRPWSVSEKEWKRETAVRNNAPCPNCRARKKQPCFDGVNASGNRKVTMMSHAARYRLVAQAGLVPALPGES